MTPVQEYAEFRQNVEALRSELLQTIQRHSATIETAITSLLELVLILGLSTLGEAETRRMVKFALEHIHLQVAPPKVQ